MYEPDGPKLPSTKGFGRIGFRSVAAPSPGAAPPEPPSPETIPARMALSLATRSALDSTGSSSASMFPHAFAGRRHEL